MELHVKRLRTGKAGPVKRPETLSLRCHSRQDFPLSLMLDASLSFYLWCEETGKSQASASDNDSLPETAEPGRRRVTVDHLPSMCQALDSAPVTETHTHKEAGMECEH